MREAWRPVQNTHLDILNKAPEQGRLLKRQPRRWGGVELAIVICPGCSHKLRIPDGKRGTVTSPRCGAEWFYPETVELSDVEFRCSVKNGARFNVILSRRSPLHKFVIQKITSAAPEPQRASEANTASASPQPALDPAVSSLALAGPKVRGWLARTLGRNTDVSPVQAPSASVLKREDTTIPIATHDIGEYNWSGFSCPYCSASSFVSGGCGHLACDGSVKLKEGRRFYQCFCGHAGFLTGTIKTVGSRRLSVEADADSQNTATWEPQPQSSRSTDMALPPPSRRPPVKR